MGSDGFSDYLSLLFDGLEITLVVSAVGLVFAVALGLVVAFVRMSRFRVVRFVGGLYIDFFRSTPLFAQLLWIFYALPILTGFSFGAKTAGIIGLALYEAAFFAEVFRAGILAVPGGQREAALAQGMTRAQVARRIVLPQAIRSMLPPATSTTVTLVKDSSLVSLIGVTDLLYQANSLAAVTLDPLGVITAAALLYFLLCYPITIAANWMHRRLSLRTS